MEILPAELWTKIAMSDPRTYNALARVCRSMNNFFDAKTARKLFTSQVVVTYKCVLGNYNIPFPTLGGMIHADSFTKKYTNEANLRELDYKCEGAFSFDKLTRHVENKPSFYLKGPDPCMMIYANNGVVARSDGPAIVLMYESTWDTIRAELHVEKGKMKMLRALRWLKYNRPEIIEANPDDYSDSLRIVDIDDSEYGKIRLTRYNIDTIISKYGWFLDNITRDRVNWKSLDNHVLRINARIAMLGTDIPSIFENILQIMLDILKIIRGRG